MLQKVPENSVLFERMEKIPTIAVETRRSTLIIQEEKLHELEGDAQRFSRMGDPEKSRPSKAGSRKSSQTSELEKLRTSKGVLLSTRTSEPDTFPQRKLDGKKSLLKSESRTSHQGDTAEADCKPRPLGDMWQIMKMTTSIDNNTMGIDKVSRLENSIC